MSCRPICNICFDEYQPDSVINITSCGHIFHSVCVLKWLKVTANCPECRRPNPQIYRAYLGFQGNPTEESKSETEIANEIEITAMLFAEEQIEDLTMQLSSKEEELLQLKRKFRNMMREMKMLMDECHI